MHLHFLFEFSIIVYSNNALDIRSECISILRDITILTRHVFHRQFFIEFNLIFLILYYLSSYLSLQIYKKTIKMFILGSYYSIPLILSWSILSMLNLQTKYVTLLTSSLLLYFRTRAAQIINFPHIVTFLLSLDYLQILMGGLGYQYEYPRVAKVTCKNIH